MSHKTNEIYAAYRYLLLLWLLADLFDIYIYIYVYIYIWPFVYIRDCM